MASNSIYKSAVFFFFLLVLAFFPSLSRGTDESIEAKVDSYFAPYLEMGNFSGVVLIGKGDEILLSKGYGMANYELGVPNSPNILFQMGSLGKQFTAVAILRLHESGRLDLADPIRKHIKEYRHGDKITIHQLLSHTSGVPELPETAVFTRSAGKDNGDNWIERLNKIKLEFAPGSKHAYRNINYMLLSEIVTRTSGTAVPDYIRENIFEPLGMTETVFNIGSVIKGRSESYYVDFDGLKNARNYSPMDGGAYYSSVEDYFRFIRGILNNKILSPASVERMLTPNLQSYGYAWYITTVENGGKLIFHGGSSTGYICSVSNLRDEDLTIIIFSNLGNISIGRMVSNLTAIALGRAYTIAKLRKVVALNPAILQRCEGSYKGEDGSPVWIRVEGDHLCIILGTKDNTYSSAGLNFKYILFPESQREFFAKEFDCQVEFVSFSAGKADRIRFTVNGSVKRLQRIEPQ